MYEASFWRVVLNLLKSIKMFKYENLDELACIIDLLIKESLESEEKIKYNRESINPVLTKIIKRHEDVKITILELEVLKLMLETIRSNQDLLNRCLNIKRFYPLISCVLVNITEDLKYHTFPTITK